MAPVIIGIDLCNTVFQINTLVFLEVYGIPHPPQELMGKYGPILPSDFWTGPKGRAIFLNARPFPGCIEKLKELGLLYDLCYITARPIEVREETLTAMKRWDFPAGKVIFTDNKSSVINDLGIKVMLEDAPKEIVDLAGVCPVLIHDQHYNKEMNESCGVRFTWADNVSLMIKKLAGDAEYYRGELASKRAHTLLNKIG